MILKNVMKSITSNRNESAVLCRQRGLSGIVVIDAACHWRTRPRFAPGTLLHRCSDLGQVVNLSLSVA